MRHYLRRVGLVGIMAGYAPWASAAPSAAQGDEFTPQVAVYGELAGSAVVTSFNVELRPLEVLTLRVGGVILPVPFLGVAPISIVGASLLAGNERHHAEFGFNYVKGWIEDDDARFLNPTLGYRYQPNVGGFLFRATATRSSARTTPATCCPGSAFHSAGAVRSNGGAGRRTERS